MIDPNNPNANVQGATPSGTALANALRTGYGTQPLSQISQQMSQGAFLRSPPQAPQAPQAPQQNPYGQYY